MLKKEDIYNKIEEIFKLNIASYDEEFVLDSLDFIDLIDLLENGYHLKIPITEFNETNFNSIDKIYEYLIGKGFKNQ